MSTSSSSHKRKNRIAILRAIRAIHTPRVLKTTGAITNHVNHKGNNTISSGVFQQV